MPGDSPITADMIADHGSASYREGLAAGASAERDRIAAWLRSLPETLHRKMETAMWKAGPSNDDYWHSDKARLAVLADHMRQEGPAFEATSPALNEPVRSKERAALGVAVSELKRYRDVAWSDGDRYRRSRVQDALDRIATILGEPTP